MGALLNGVPSDGDAVSTPLGDAIYPLDDWARAISTAVEAIIPAGYVAGDLHGPAWVSLSTRTVAQGNLFLVPYFVRSTQTFDQIIVETTTAGTGSTVVRLGIWNHNTATGKPGTLILDAGTINGTAAAGVKPATISQSLTAGWVWLGCVGQTVTGSPAVRGFINGINSGMLPHTSIGAGSIPTNSLLVTGITGPLSTLVGSTFAIGNTSAPLIQLRAA